MGPLLRWRRPLSRTLQLCMLTRSCPTIAQVCVRTVCRCIPGILVLRCSQHDNTCIMRVLSGRKQPSTRHAGCMPIATTGCPEPSPTGVYRSVNGNRQTETKNAGSSKKSSSESNPTGKLYKCLKCTISDACGQCELCITGIPRERLSFCRCSTSNRQLRSRRRA